MNVKGIKHSSDWEFSMPKYLIDDIEALIAAMERNDPNLDCYQDEVEGSARAVSEAHDRELYDYYLRGGYVHDLTY